MYFTSSLYPLNNVYWYSHQQCMLAYNKVLITLPVTDSSLMCSAYSASLWDSYSGLFLDYMFRPSWRTRLDDAFISSRFYPRELLAVAMNYYPRSLWFVIARHRFTMCFVLWAFTAFPSSHSIFATYLKLNLSNLHWKRISSVKHYS